MLVSGLAGISFYNMWLPSSLVGRIAESIGLSRQVFLGVLAVLGAAIAFYAVWVIFCFLLINIDKINNMPPISPTKHNKDITAAEYLLLFLAALCVITVCSKSSPLYPLNDWVDANCFFTVGKSMVNGKVLYRDIYEQKGFYLYALHALAYCISNTTFLGVYILEIIISFLFLLISYKTIRLFCNKEAVVLIPLFAALIYTSAAFCHGDSAEEFCLPLIAYPLYLGISNVKNSHISLSRRDALSVGLTAGVVLFIKFSMLGFYVGWFLIPSYLYVKQHDYRGLMQTILCISAGVLLASLPVILYFFLNHALGDLWEVYFYNNIFLYAFPYSSNSASSQATQIPFFSASLHAFQLNLLPSVSCLLALLWFKKHIDRHVFLLILFSFIGTMLLIFSSKNACVYYPFILCPFVFLSIIMVNQLCAHRFRDKRKALVLFSCLSLLICFLFNNSSYFLLEKKDNLPQYQFKDVIETVEHPTLLNYGFLDGGFYTVCNIVPNCRFFCLLNLSLDEMYETQNSFVKEGKTDFVVTRDAVLDDLIDAPQYVCVDQAVFPFEGKDWTYRLYERSDLL